MDKQVLKNLIETRKKIRQKYNALKSGKMALDSKLADTFKTITEPLKKIAEKELVGVEHLKSKRKKINESHPGDIKRRLTFDDDNDHYNNDDSYYDLSIPPQTPTKFKQYFDYHENPEAHNLDTKYGVYKSGEDYKIGNSIVTTDSSGNVVISGKKYIGTEGLYQLLFDKYPNKEVYTEEDFKNYSKILIESNAHKRGYNKYAQIRGNASFKYKNIIKKIASSEKKKSGKGMKQRFTIKNSNNMNFMNIPSSNIDYIHWDDPNELVDRLRLLIASQQAGHNNHNNEIISILEELKEANIISSYKNYYQ